MAGIPALGHRMLDEHLQRIPCDHPLLVGIDEQKEHVSNLPTNMNLGITQQLPRHPDDLGLMV